MQTIISYFESLNPVLAAFLATVFTWFLTALGASLVFPFKSMPRKYLDTMLGFTGGVMVAASFWSLLSPAIEMAEVSWGSLAFVPAAIGFGLGALFLFAFDKFMPHLHLNFDIEHSEGVKTKLHKKIIEY